MMPEEEINDLARELSTFEDGDVKDSAAIIAREYRQAIGMIHALDGVDRMLQEDIVAVENRLQERLLRAREHVRDKLKGLLEWARANGRM